MHNFISDLTFGFRLLRKNYSFSLTSVLVIVLGLTVSLCVYSILYEFRKPPSFPEGERFAVVKVYDHVSGVELDPATFNGYAYHRFEKQVTAFEDFGAFSLGSAALSSSGVSQRVELASLTPNLMEITNVLPFLGRNMSAEDANPASPPVALISYQLWENYFNRDSDIIGKPAQLDGLSYSIVGVMPADFSYPLSQNVWLPLEISEATPSNAPTAYYMVGKLRAGVSQAAASAELNGVLRQIIEEHPALYSNVKAEVSNFNEIRSQGLTNTDFLFNSIAIVIFLLASLNLSALLFTRASERREELAVRNAVGASIWQLRKQVLLESGTLCLIGAIIAIFLSEFVLMWIQASVDYVLYTLGAYVQFDFRLHPAALFYAAVATISIWLISASTTVFKIGNSDLSQVLESGAKGATSKAKAVGAQLIVTFETIVSCFLLILCGLLVFSIFSIYRIDFGTATDQLYSGSISLSSADYSSSETRQLFRERLDSGLVSHPEIKHVSYSSALPGGWGEGLREFPYGLEDRNLTENNVYPTIDVIAVSPDYFSSIDVDLISGRGFEQTDNDLSLNVVIIDELLANQLWSNDSPLGKRIALNPDNNTELLTIIGVSPHIITGQPVSSNLFRSVIYRPMKQDPVQNFFTLVEVEQEVQLSLVVDLMGREAAKIDRNIPIDRVMPLYDYQRLGLSSFDVLGRMFTGFALIALLLSVIGIYGIVSRSVSQRTSEIGIRRALGSSDRGIIGIFLRQGLHYLLIGSIVGGTLAVLTSGVMVQLFPDILSGLPIVVSLVLLSLATLILLASYLPARKLVAMEPGEALHYE